MVSIPGPREADADDVSLALEVAQSQWARGDHAEALKWLKKAVDAAFEADDDKRGMELSKVAAEVKAELDAPAKPKVPPPRAASGAPTRPSAPPPRQSAPKPPPPKPKQQASQPGPSSPPPRKRPKPEPRAPVVDEDEATREYKLVDVGGEAAIADEWPTETLDNVDDLVEEQPESKPVKSRKHGQKAGKSKSKKREGTKTDAAPHRAKPKTKDLAASVPSTKAIRVAVGRQKGEVYVRLLDSQGLRPGEHDAMLVALTSDGDIRALFKE